MNNKAFRTLLEIFAIVVVLALVELAAALAFKAHIAVRTTKPEVPYPYHQYLGWENCRNYEYTGVLAGGLTRWANRTDSAGESVTPLFDFPDPDVSVVVVGGSAVFGVGQTDNEHTVPSQIELELNRRTGLRVEVHNLAVGGYTSFQEMLALERFVSNHRADVVVSISGYNDAFAAAYEGTQDFGLMLHRVEPKAELIRSIERGDLKVVPVTAGLLIQALRRKSNAVDLLGKAVLRLVPPPPPPQEWEGIPIPDSAEVVRRARFVMTNYAMMDGIARQRGARFFMFLQPTVMTRGTLGSTESHAFDSFDPAFKERTLPVVRVFYPAAIAAEKSFEFHDITHCFDDFRAPAFGDDCHYLDGATATVAGAVCDVITPAVIEAAHRRGITETAQAAGARPAR